jgi:LPS sulfotransferase NodH
MNEISNIFKSLAANPNRLNELEALPEPRSRYIIAMTPRSGSSYLCDLMKKGKQFGAPGEFINPIFIPGIIKNIPGRTAEEYLRNTLRITKTSNGVSGFKTSWFQFQGFKNSMNDEDYLSGFKYIYLTRRDLAAQAVSLYKATSSSVFQTNIQHHEEAIKKLESLTYDYAGIKNWYGHIIAQEKGWQRYFHENHIVPLSITYEEIEADVLGVIKRIAGYIDVDPATVTRPKEVSVFKKMRDSRNTEWAQRFTLERSVQEQALSEPGLARKIIKTIKRVIKRIL